MNGQTSSLQIREELLDLAERYFNTQIEFIPSDFDIHLGIYRKPPNPYCLFKGTAQERARKLGVCINYLVYFDKRPVILVDADKNPYRFVLSRTFAADREFITGIDQFNRLADPIWDDEEEMKINGFAYAAEIAKMSHATRYKNFSQDLDEVKAPEGLGVYATYFSFHDQLALRCTYNKNQEYYPKWRMQRPFEKKDREFLFENLSDQYIKTNFYEIELLRKSNYLMLLLDGKRMLFQLATIDSQGSNRIHPTLLHADVTLGDPQEIYEKLPSYKDRKAIFFYSFHGTEQYHKLNPHLQQSPKLSVNLNELVVDPKCMVKKTWGVNCDAPDNSETNGWSDWDWFVEMVRLHFPLRVYEIYTLGINMFYAVDREKLFLDSIEDAHDNAKGPLKEALESLLDELKTHEHLLLVARGARIGNRQRFVGTDGFWIYLYNTETQLTTKMFLWDFVYNLHVGSLADKIYKRTQHLIPIIKVVTWGATIVASGSFIGGAALVKGAHSFMRDVFRHETSKKAVRQLFERFRIQVYSLITHGFLSVLPTGDSKLFSLVAGFLKGFSYDAINTLFEKYKTLVYRGPSYYRYYKLYKQIMATIQKIENKVAELTSRVSNKVAEELADRLAEIMIHSQRATILLFSAMLFLDYELVEPHLEDLAVLSQQKTLDKRNWEKQRQNRLKEVLTNPLQHYRKEIIELSSNKVDQKIKNWYIEYKRQVAVRIFDIERSLIIFETGNIWTYLIAILALSGYDILANDATFVKGIINLITKPVQNFQHYQPQEAKKLGELLGHVVGAFFLNRSIFAKGTRLGKLKSKKKKKLIDLLLVDELKHGLVTPFIKLLLGHYIILWERYKGTGEKLWKTLEKDIDEILDSGHRDLAGFQPPNERKLSFNKIVRLLTKLDEVLYDNLRELARTPDLDQKLLEMAASIGKVKIPTFQDLLDGKLPPEWSQEGILYIMLSHLSIALTEVGKALSLIINPLDSDKTLTLIDLLAIIGIEIDPTQSDELLAQELNLIFGRP